MSIGAAPRTYHSVAVLLKDGRVFSGGGGLCGNNCDVNHFDGQIFSPPYLYKADDTLATRPTIRVNKGVAVNGDTLTVTGNVALSMVSIIRLGSATHSVDTDQRRIELCGPSTTACAGRTNTVTIPADSGIAIAGNWMVFGLNGAGVPSVSEIVKIGAPPPAAARSTAARSQPTTLVAASATPTDATTGNGTAAPIDMTFESTPANPALPMPPGTQLE